MPEPTTATTQPADNVLTLLPAVVRRTIYLAYGLLSLAATALTAYFGAVPGLTVPHWLTGGLAMLGALAAPVSVLAAANIRPSGPKSSG